MMHVCYGLCMGPPPGGIFCVDSDSALNLALDADGDSAASESAQEVDIVELEVGSAAYESFLDIRVDGLHRIAGRRYPCTTGTD